MAMRVCPHCDKTRPDLTGDIAMDFPVVSVELWCPDCGATYWEIYGHTGYELEPKPIPQKYLKRMH